MARVFVSWGGSDKDVVTRLVTHFRSAGLDLFEYTDDMRGGDQIHERVLGEIHLAEVALLCLSDQSVARDWVQRECHWCFSDLMNRAMPMKKLIVVEVNTLSETRVPSLLKESWLHRFNIYRSRDLDRGLGALLADVLYILGGPMPLFVPATIFAMSAAQAGDLLLDQCSWAALRSLGQHLGMEWHNGPPSWLHQRYGDTFSDFRPFLQDKSLIKIAQETIEWVNRNDLLEQPVHVIWYDPTDLLKDMLVQGPYWAHFNSNRHIIIIDSISMLHSCVSTCLNNMLASLYGGVDWRALTWLPPYTQHTFDLEDLIFEATRIIAPLASEFHRWKDQPGCSSSFDASTKIGFQHWLWDAIARVTGSPKPQRENLVQLTNMYPGPRTAPFRSLRR